MKSDILSQCYIFLIFILNGIAIGLIFDVFRTLRKSFKTSDIITYIEDILFWIISGAMTLYLIFHLNNGELRAYIFVGLVIGIILYMLLLSKIFIKANIFLISITKKVVQIIAYPIEKVIISIIVITRNIKMFFQNIFQKSSKYIKNINKFMKKVFKIHKKEGKSVEM